MLIEEVIRLRKGLEENKQNHTKKLFNRCRTLEINLISKELTTTELTKLKYKLINLANDIYGYSGKRLTRTFLCFSQEF